VNAGKGQAINVVLVPSAFNGNMALFSQKAAWIASDFSKYKPLDAKVIFGLNVWYVDEQMADDDGNQCYFNCNGIPRALCCRNGGHNFKRHAMKHCGSGITMAVIVVHNSLTYGGTGGNPATVSLSPDAPQVAVHELGHSLFGLGDEYDSFSARPEHDPNCDYQGCPKWSDLIGKWGVRCVPRKCDGGNFYASGETGMDLLGLPFGAANERITCCKYLYHTRTSPGYCSKFSTQGLNLQSWCDKNLWKGRYGNIGMQLSALERNSNASASIDYLKFVADDPQGLQYVYVEHPAEWIVERQPNASWTCLQSSLDLNSGLYQKKYLLWYFS